MERFLPASASNNAFRTIFSGFARNIFFQGLMVIPPLWKNSVSTGPGHTEVTVIPLPFSSAPNAWSKEKT